MTDQLLLDLDEKSDRWWRDCAWRVLEQLAKSGREFQARDLVDCGVPEPAHPNHWGSLLYAARQAGLVERVGFAQSKRPETRGSIVRVWRGRS